MLREFRGTRAAQWAFTFPGLEYDNINRQYASVPTFPSFSMKTVVIMTATPKLSDVTCSHCLHRLQKVTQDSHNTSKL
jgi:hypothetical protein